MSAIACGEQKRKKRRTGLKQQTPRNIEVQRKQELLNRIAPGLLTWYDKSRRSLPWREEPTPYRVWVSEIMLQQTRVEAVKPYFARFMERLPDIEALAEVDDDELLKLWEGLGYYSRARNLKAAAQQIVTEYGGEMPSDYRELLKLKGTEATQLARFLRLPLNSQSRSGRKCTACHFPAFGG